MEKGYGLRSSCLKCKKCEKVCPQHLPVSEYLEKYVVPEIEKYDPNALIQEEA